MAVKIRLARLGRIRTPFYRIVVADARAPRDGKFIEIVGTYNPLMPKDKDGRINMDADLVRAWIKKGAKPTERVKKLMKVLEV